MSFSNSEKSQLSKKLTAEQLNEKTVNDLGNPNLMQPELEKLKSIWATKLQPALNNAGSYIKANPWTSIGLGFTGAANIGGLFDNDKIGGQLIGGAAGGAAGHWLLPKLLGHAVSPQAQVLMGLGGGAIGSLFDKLRQNKEDQFAAQLNAIQQNTQGGYY